MDPMAEPLSCACVDGMGQRDYQQLADHLEFCTGRAIQLTFEESLKLAIGRIGRNVDLVIGKQSVVRFDAKQTELPLRLVATLSDRRGRTDLRGVLLVRTNDPAQTVSDLKGRKVMLGPPEDAETHAAAKKLLKQHGGDAGTTIETAGSLDAATFALADDETDAAALPDFMPMFLEACGKVEKGSLRVLGHTKREPFIGVFASERVNADVEQTLRQALAEAADDALLLDALESKLGFLDPKANREQAAAPPSADVVKKAAPAPAFQGWTDWRGPGRTGLSKHVPQTLPAKPKVLWSADVTGPAMAGIGATQEYVVVPDKDAAQKADVLRCFDANSGKSLWTLEYPADVRIQYTNSPRAAPVMHGDVVYLQGAAGDLHCLELASGRVLWRKNLLDEFLVELLPWGSSVPPLVVDDKLIVAPGAPQASVVALDLKTGNVVWKTPGHAAAYSAFVVGTWGGVRQIVGYDVAGLGGWDPRTGRRLWEMVPPRRSDFNVGTPVDLAGGILLATENNGTRLYEFGKQGLIRQQPVALNDDPAPDTCTPVVIDDRVFCTAYGELFCLDPNEGLKTVWSVLDDLYYDHTNLIAGNHRVLISNTEGDLVLVRADTDKYDVVSHIRPFGEEEVESMSHPALLGDRIYVRSQKKLLCLSLKTH